MSNSCDFVNSISYQPVTVHNIVSICSELSLFSPQLCNQLTKPFAFLALSKDITVKDQGHTKMR